MKHVRVINTICGTTLYFIFIKFKYKIILRRGLPGIYGGKACTRGWEMLNQSKLLQFPLLSFSCFSLFLRLSHISILGNSITAIFPFVTLNLFFSKYNLFLQSRYFQPNIVWAKIWFFNCGFWHILN